VISPASSCYAAKVKLHGPRRKGAGVRNAIRVAVAAVALGGAGAGAQGIAVPVALPGEERIIYGRTVGSATSTIEEHLILVSTKEETHYEVTSRSDESDGLFRLDPRTLIATYAEVTTRSEAAVISRVTTLRENRAVLTPDELQIGGFESITQTLRAFPWGSAQKARLVFAGQRSNGFDYELSVSGKETITVGGRSYECWKAQLGLNGFFGALMGKTTVWYSVSGSHFLVRMQGASMGPGSPTATQEIVSYWSSSDR
jgi:hypothetical protein